MTAAKAFTITLTGFLLLRAAPARGDEAASGFVNRVHKSADGTEAKYVVFVPHNYRGDRPYPLILFLHGAAEWGTDGQRQVTSASGPRSGNGRRPFPFWLPFPSPTKRPGRSISRIAGK